MKKMLVSDYDNTFYTDEDTVLKNVSKVNEFKENGNFFTIATSRSWNSISKELEKYNIKCDYIICNAGAVIIKEEKPIYINFLKPEIVTQIEEILKKESDIEITRFTENEDENICFERLLGYKIKGDKKRLKELKSILEEKNLNLEIVYNNENKLFINGNSKKEKAISKINEMIDAQIDIITVGDDLVDIGMVEKYNGYRMKDSSEGMKKVTDKEVSSVYELLENEEK